MANVDYSGVLCFDLEMCCWNEPVSRTGEIISIGVAEFCLRTGSLKNVSEYIVKPDSDDISDFCTQLTGLTAKKVNAGRSLATVLDSLKVKYGSKRAYVAWGTDAAVLNAECVAKGIESPILRSIDAQLLYMVQKGHVGKMVSMKKAMAEQGLEFEGRQHNALTDATNLGRLVVKTGMLTGRASNS